MCACVVTVGLSIRVVECVLCVPADRVKEYWGWRVVQELDEDLERLVPLSVGEATPGPITTTSLPTNHHLGLLSGAASVPVLQRDPRADSYNPSGEAPANLTV